MPDRKHTKKERQSLLAQSVAFYIGTFTFAGQLGFHWLKGVSIDPYSLVITGALILVPLFGKDFFIELVRAVRGARGGNGDGDVGE